MIGTKLAHYEITSHLGTGGMGEVYQATDSKLGRGVAIKLLPAAFASEPERLSRFRREAQVLASLNHPNIAQIYGLEESGETCCIVMELVDGETLQARLKQGPIPVDEALAIAKQIAEALEAAHDRGVIHRDLKPGNVMLTADGKVKVLDFGLAKAYEANPPDARLSNSPTMVSMAATNAGVILGTAAYMSPEQASGKLVDKRADIWSFGVVLFEMLTGRGLFEGETVSHTLADVLRGPIDFNTLPAATPPAIRNLLRRCLNRDIKKRLRDIGEASIAIDESANADAQESETASIPQKRRISSWAPWAVAAVLVVALGVSLWAWAPWRSEKPVDRPLVRLDVDLGSDVSLGSPYGADVTISPDGARLVYVSQAKLFTRRLDQSKDTELPGTGGAYAPFFSPDGKWVAFFGGGKLRKISVEGGAPVTLCDSPQGRGGSWGEDGNIIANLTGAGGPLVRIPSSGGTPTPVTVLAQGEFTHRWPQLLPGGKAVLFTVSAAAAGFDAANVEVVSLVDGRRKTLVRGGTFGRYVASANGAGHLIYVNRGTLFAAPFDPDALEVRGTTSPVLAQVAYSAGQGDAQLDISRTGTLLYRSGGGGGGLVTVHWLDSAGKAQSLLAKPAVYLRPSLSPDGQRMAVTIVEESADIWVYDWQRDNITRLTFGGGDYAIWSPDSRYILFQSPGGMSRIRADGGGKPQAFTESKNVQYPWSFAPDGKRLAFLEVNPATGFDLWTVPVENDSAGLRPGKPEPFLQTPADERYSAFSSDGKWLAYASSESGVYQIYVRAFPDTGGKWQVSNSGGVYPIWSRNGHELFFETLDNRVMASTYTVKGDSFIVDKPRLWSDKRLGGIAGSARGYDLAPDGKRIAALIPADTPEALKAQNHVIFLENFFDELRRRAPVGK